MYNPQLETFISVADAGSLTYAIIKSYECAKLMISSLEETENSQMYSFYLEDAV